MGSYAARIEEPVCTVMEYRKYAKPEKVFISDEFLPTQNITKREEEPIEGMMYSHSTVDVGIIPNCLSDDDDRLKKSTGVIIKKRPFPHDGKPEGAEDALNVLAARRRMDEAESGITEEEPEANGGFCYQIGSTIWRILLLMRREWISTLCGLLVPMIFVVGSIILWLIFGRSKQDATMYFEPQTPTVIADALSSLHSAVCYNQSEGTIPGLSPCPPSMTSLYCPASLGIPRGFCYDTIIQIPAIYGVVSLFQGNTSIIPSFDDMVLLHWINMDTTIPNLPGPNNAGSALSYGGTLYFTPNNAVTQQLVNYFNASSTFFDLVYGGIYDSPAELEKLLHKRTAADPPNWGFIQVNQMTEKNFDVSIRLNASALPSSASAINDYYIGGLGKNTGELYLLSGFLTLQQTVAQFFSTQILNVVKNETFYFAPTSTVSYDSQDFLSFGGQLAPLILILGFLFPVSQLTRRIVVEKELRIREAMLIMGLTQPAMYISWFLVYMVLYLFFSFIISILLKTTYLPQTDFFIIFFTFLLFLYSTITLSALLSTLFSKARLAALLSPLIYFVLSIPLFAMQNASGQAKLGMLVLSPSALAVGIGLIFQHEVSGGMSGKDIGYFRDYPNMITVYIFLIVDIFLYLLIMVYLDCVIPKDWGTTKGPFFCIVEPIRWLLGRHKADDPGDEVEDGRASDGVFEEARNSADSPVKILGLRKSFRHGNEKFIAVNNLFWSMPSGEISVLLGHNGAGKSTTMNLMTGMLKPDGGDCIIYGKSIRYELSEARKEIGFCPQHNILWPLLTCREHLNYYAAIKGLRGKAKETAVNTLLEDVDLMEKENYLSKDLSGGQKRKLSVAVAFVGGSRLIFLDEPTAGMDAGARRHTWGLLKRMAKKRTILLTTHFMDEADLLGSNVAIMSKGRMQCSGSNLFLKSHLGVGYAITMSVIAHVKREFIEEMIRSFVPDAESLGSGAGEVSYRLPMRSKGVFPQLLKAVEERSKELGIKSYSLAATTLEEIFLKIAKKEEERISESSQSIDDRKNILEHAKNVWDVELTEGTKSLLWMQFVSMMIKRFHNTSRDRRVQFFQIAYPVGCVLLAMLLTLLKVFHTPSITLDGSIYGTTVELSLGNCASTFNLSNPLSASTISQEVSGVSNGLQMSEYLLDTFKNHTTERYGAIVCNDPLIGGSQGIYYNTSAYHDIAVTFTSFYRGIFQKAVGPDLAFTTKVDPMPKTEREEQFVSSKHEFMISILIMVPFTFIPSTFVSFIVKERECKARHQQSVSGLNFYIYWISNFLFDLCSYIVTMFLVIAVFGIFNRTEYVSHKNIGPTIVLFLLYGLSGIAMAYTLSFLFNEHSTAQNVVMLANFIMGFLLVLAVAVLMMTPSTNSVAEVLRWIFRIIPSYCVGEGISNLAVLKLQQTFDPSKGPWDMKVIGWPCVYMAAELPFFFFLTLFIDHPTRRQKSQRLMHNPDAPPEIIEDEDADVQEERKEVTESPERASDLVKVINLRKKYDNGKVAVRNVTFGVKPGEVFGFLGTNGAGKTTTISILCQEFFPSSGRAFICGNDIAVHSRKALQCIGYCPQFDACLDLLTVEEHLYMYSRIRGISDRTRPKVVEGLMTLCELMDYRNTKSRELSGGNRRKLSVALSLIGGPRVVFFDEPSAGMDPVARRGLWTAIETVSDNCSVVLTTHHLEEVEALAHRVAIMVDGSIRCIGDKTHLKSKYGSGFEAHLRLQNDEEESQKEVEKFMSESFTGCKLVECNSGRITYELPGDTRLSVAFTLFEEHKERLQIADYSISQTSIEQVFLRISAEAELEAE